MASPSGVTPRVLVIDDDPSVLATYRRVLRRAGYDASYFDDPEAVLQAAQGCVGAELLLLDYRMPGIDGLTLLAELRNQGCRARCILISAYLNEDVRERATILAVDAVLDKPVDVCTLRTKVAELLPSDPAGRGRAEPGG